MFSPCILKTKNFHIKAGFHLFQAVFHENVSLQRWSPPKHQYVSQSFHTLGMKVLERPIPAINAESVEMQRFSFELLTNTTTLHHEKCNEMAS